MPNSNGKRQIAETFLLGLRTRDWPLLRTIMTQDIVWTLPGHSRISEEARGIEAVIERSQVIVSYGLNFQLNHILEGQHGLALSLHNTAHHEGKTLDEHVATVCQLQEHKISSIDTYLSDVDMVNSFFV
jgi:uncharacterized protein